MLLEVTNASCISFHCVFTRLSSSSCVSMLSRPAVRVRRLAAHLSKAMSSDHHASSPSFAANGEAPTAAILIIGDEILKVHRS